MAFLFHFIPWNFLVACACPFFLSSSQSWFFSSIFLTSLHHRSFLYLAFFIFTRTKGNTVYIGGLKGHCQGWQNFKKSGCLFQVRILSSWWYHNNITFFQLQYTGIVISINCRFPLLLNVFLKSWIFGAILVTASF